METLHATLIDIDGKGVLIQGASGSGKTSLALHLLRRCHCGQIPTMLVADDQVCLSFEDGALVGHAPPNLAGKVEIRGLGIMQFESQTRLCELVLHVELVENNRAVRLWDGMKFSYRGAELKSLKLPRNSPETAANAILAALGFPLWV